MISSHLYQKTDINLTIVLSSQSAKKQFLVSTYQKTDYDAIVKTREKGFQETAKSEKSLEIPYFKPVSVLFYLFRDRRHTVSTWVEETVLMSDCSQLFSGTNRLTTLVPANINSSWKQVKKP